LRHIWGILLVVGLAAAIAIQPVAALPTMAIPFFTCGPIVFADPQQAASLTIVEANTTHFADTDAEASSIQLAVPDKTAPFGFAIRPQIEQTCDQNMAADRAYLFEDFMTSSVGT